MAGYIGTKAVLLSTTAATVTGDAEIAGDLTVGSNAKLFWDASAERLGIGSIAPSEALTVVGKAVLGDVTTSLNQLTINGGHVADGGNDYGLTINSFEPAITLIDRSTGAGSVQLFGTNNGGMWIRGDTANDGTIGHTANTTDFMVAKFEPINTIFYTNGAESMRIDSSGNVLVGTTSNLNSARLFVKATGDACGLQVGSTSGNQAAVVFYDGSGDYCGQIQLNPSSNTAGFISSSDYRLKEDWQPIIGASERVLALNPVNFAWKADGSRVDGFLAHEAQEVVPEAVTGTKDGMRTEEYEVTPAVYEDVIIPAVDAVLDEEGNVITEAQPERTEQRLVSEAVMGTREVPDYQGIDQSKLVPLLTAALQEALTEIAALKDRVAALEAN